MWVAEFTYDGSESPIGSIAKKYSVSVCAYPVSVTKKKDGVYVYFTGQILGNSSQELIDEIKKKTLFFETDSDSFVALLQEPLRAQIVYAHTTVHVRPIYIDNKGMETWTVGSTTKKNLLDFYVLLRKMRNAKLLSIKNKQTTLSIRRIDPSLTSKQRKAIGLAIKKGYYEVPRKISVQELAKISGLAFSTFQVHLRKAESKIMPESILYDIYR